MSRYGHLLLAITMILGLAAPAPACGPYGVEPAHLAALAVHGDEPLAAFAIERLRALGPRGVAALVERHPDLTPGDPAWDAYRRAIDRVGRQRDNHAARLFWHTDLDDARAAAAATGKPILSLRLLGGLDEELSCANSRFFRTALYANEAISKTLRDEFVLHWRSERPVPEITIDFGDGRRLVRTITGNSVHYVLAADGRPIDALPGLHGPGAFQRWLQRGAAAVREVGLASPSDSAPLVTIRHLEWMDAIVRTWTSEHDAYHAGRPDHLPMAFAAAEVAVTKARLEMPILRRTMPVAEALRARATAGELESIAAMRLDECRLDAGSRALLASKQGGAESDLDRMIETFERHLALDTVRNERLLHTTIHGWFAAGEVTDLESLNARIYAELFLTPAGDPWLGLLPPDTYAALDGGGVTTVEE